MRFYNGVGELPDAPSVTSITGDYDNAGIGFGRVKETNNCAWDDFDVLTKWRIDGNEKAFKAHLRGAAGRKWGEAADLGTAIHGLAEKYYNGEPLGNLHPDHKPFIDHLEQFTKDFDVEPVEVEVTIWNQTVNYAGTADLFAKVAGELICLDLKTGASGIWPSVALQLAAYCHGEFIIEPDGTRRDLPTTEGAAALSLRPDHYKLVPVRVDDEVFDVFRHLAHVAQWQLGIKKQVLGVPVEPQTSGEN